ncbi:Atu1372/SO_1960 family protein [Rapidithrix thailandica]|uniref:Atu1372/SO_1960 family protein n=1 Tax=Rapidithrix thailandica TaxID=413964 RepID=A0AAW9RYD9_9BACT
MKLYSTICLVLTIFFVSNIQAQKAKILVLIHSDNGGTYKLAKEIATGIEAKGEANAYIKQVKASEHPILKSIPVAEVEELTSYDGIAFGSPIYFGNMSTAMSEFLAKTVNLWSNHALEGMPATVFMSAGSGAGKELAIQSFWNSLSVHGMILVSNGMRGYESVDKTIPQGNTVLGTTSLASLNNVERPSQSERLLARLQGQKIAKVALALKGTFSQKRPSKKDSSQTDVHAVLKAKQIELPKVPEPAGNYQPFVRTGNLVFINQVALKNGKIVHPGKLGKGLTEEQVQEATRVAILNVLSVLKDAVDGDLNRVKKCVQLTGIFNTKDDYTQHAALMNVASNLLVDIFGEKGRHARATYGASSIPVNSSVEIQAVFEIE